jgi:hypothetical protein
MAEQRVKDFWYLGNLLLRELTSYGSLPRVPAFCAATKERHRVTVVTMT